MPTVGVRRLKAQLSHYLRLVQRGERIVITARDRPVAMLAPAAVRPDDQQVNTLLRDGLARWDGGKPRGSRKPPKVAGAPLARAVSEGRR